MSVEGKQESIGSYSETFPHPYDLLVEMFGLENSIKFAKAFGGSYLYVPKYDCLIRESRNDQIFREFDGTNCKQLAKKYGLTENWIREIVNKKRRRLTHVGNSSQ